MNYSKIRRLYLKYSYMFTRSEFYNLVHNILDSIKQDNINGNIDDIFMERLSNYIDIYLKECAKDSNKLLKIIFNYIDKKIKIWSSYNACLNELQKLTNFLAKIDINLDYYIFIDLIENNEKIEKLLSIIVSSNMNLIWTVTLDKLLNDSILLGLIEAYCLLNNIDKDDSLIFGNRLIISSMELYEKDINTFSISSYNDEELLKQIKDGNKKAKDILVEKYLKLVLKIATRYVNHGLELEDLVQEGNIGLIKAVDRYDSTRKTKFSTCAKWWISQGITRAIANKSRDFRFTDTIKSNYSRLKKEYNNLKEELKREPTFEELATRLKMSLSQVFQLYTMCQDFISLDSIIDEDDIKFDDDTIFDIDKYIDSQSLKQEVFNLIKNCGLSDKEIKIILLRSGFYNNREFNVKDTAKIVGVSREWCRQLEAKALKKITNSYLTRSLASYTSNPEKSLIELQESRDFYNNQDYCCRRLFLNRK